MVACWVASVVLLLLVAWVAYWALCFFSLIVSSRREPVIGNAIPKHDAYYIYNRYGTSTVSTILERSKRSKENSFIKWPRSECRTATCCCTPCRTLQHAALAKTSGNASARDSTASFLSASSDDLREVNMRDLTELNNL